MTDTPQVAAARIEVERSRARLMGRAHELQDRLSPRTLARDAWDGAKEKGAGLAEDAVDAVRSRPLAATGVVAAIAMFLAREPLIDLAGQLAGGVNGKRKARKARKAAAKSKTPVNSEKTQ
ncbi:MAG: DUF3618 domain-containing protein [Sphingomicrobium sp.]